MRVSDGAFRRNSDRDLFSEAAGVRALTTCKPEFVLALRNEPVRQDTWQL